MICGKCGEIAHVVNSRKKNGNITLRRYECLECKARFSTIERIVNTTDMPKRKMTNIIPHGVIDHGNVALVNAMIDRGYTVVSLKNLIGVSHQTVYNWIKGGRITISNAKKIADVLGGNIEDYANIQNTHVIQKDEQ